MLKVYADKKLELNVSGNARVHADQGDLTEILGNLLDNACKWARGTVSLKIETDTRRGLRLVVQDDGPGIPLEQRSNILERGVRADEHAPGQGLGLALVRETGRRSLQRLHFSRRDVVRRRKSQCLHECRRRAVVTLPAKRNTQATSLGQRDRIAVHIADYDAIAPTPFRLIQGLIGKINQGLR